MWTSGRLLYYYFINSFNVDVFCGYRKITYPAGNYMFKVKKKNTRTRSEICSKLTIKTPGRRQ